MVWSSLGNTKLASLPIELSYPNMEHSIAKAHSGQHCFLPFLLLFSCEKCHHTTESLAMGLSIISDNRTIQKRTISFECLTYDVVCSFSEDRSCLCLRNAWATYLETPSPPALSLSTQDWLCAATSLTRASDHPLIVIKRWNLGYVLYREFWNTFSGVPHNFLSQPRCGFGWKCLSQALWYQHEANAGHSKDSISVFLLRCMGEF